MASLQADDDQLVKETIKQAEAAPAAEDEVIFDDEEKEEEPTEEVKIDSKDLETEPIIEEGTATASTGEEASKEVEFARDYFEAEEEEEDKNEAEDNIKIED